MMDQMITRKRKNPSLMRLRDLDPEIDDRVVSAVFTEQGGWKVFAESGTGNVRLLWVPAQRITPRVGDRVRVYGSQRLRGIDINDESIFYELPPLWDVDIFDDVDDAPDPNT